MDLLNLEQQRQSLELNLQILRESLRHWQTWEAEYEGLKEELERCPSEPTVTELESVAQTYDGELVNEKEVRELIGLDKGSLRASTQIVGLIQRRQEYVQKNIETVQRQFFDAEAKSEELAFAAANQSSKSQGGLPLTEIQEELDEEGNVISSTVTQPEESTANVIASLRKAGLSSSDLDTAPSSKLHAEDLKPAITNTSPLATSAVNPFEKRSTPEVSHSRTSSAGAEDSERPSRKKSVSFTADTKPPEERPRPESADGRKSVSFAEKVAVMPAAPPPDTRSVSFSPKVEEIPPQPVGPISPDVVAQANGGVQAEIDPRSRIAASLAIANQSVGAEDEEALIPEDESPEDARTRRELLEYHLNEVGDVVAQMELDEPNLDVYDDEDEEDEEDSVSHRTTSDFPDDEDTPYTTGMSESEDSEDEFGRTKQRIMSPEYIKQMEELHGRLIGNIGPDPQAKDIAAVDAELHPKDARRLVIRNKRSSTSSASSDTSEKKSGSKKRVSFAEELDVAEPGSPPLKAQKHQDGENVAPVTSNIVERTSATSHALPQHISNQATSQPAAGRAMSMLPGADDEHSHHDSEMDDSDTRDPPLGPPGVTIADTLIERTPAPKMADAPTLDDHDAMTSRRELATEYYRRRNELVQSQGGFSKSLADEENGLGELMEERDGKLKKVSRFKAARIQPS